MVEELCESCDASAKYNCKECKSTYYCSEACQALDWDDHSKTCSPSTDSEDEELAWGADSAPLLGAAIQRMRRKPKKKVMKTKTTPKPRVFVDVPTKGNFTVVVVVNKASTGEWGMHVLANLKQIVIISPVELGRAAVVGIAREIKDGLLDRNPNYTKAFIESGVLIPTKEIDAVNPRHRARFEQSELLLKDIIDSEGKVKEGMPWQRPYRVWPIMNFWRLYKATRKKDRTPGRLHVDRSLRYSGINALTLECDYKGCNDVAGRGRMIPFYLTLIQVKDLGGTVKRGAKGIAITRWIDDKSVPKESQQASRKAADEKGAALRGFARKFIVVNARDVEGTAFEEKLREVLVLMANEDDRVNISTGRAAADEPSVGDVDEPSVSDISKAIQTAPTDPEVVNTRAQSLLNEIIMAAEDPPVIVWGVTVIPHYSVSMDRINMPPLEAYPDPGRVWRTVFHELTHWTNKEKRTPRKFKDEGHFTTKSLTGQGTRTVFQDEEMPPKGARAVEELIAEIGSYMLLGEAGLDTQPWAAPTSEAYIRNWVAALNQTKRRFWLSMAANVASRAVDFLLRSRAGQMFDLFGDNDLDLEAQEAEEFEQEGGGKEEKEDVVMRE